MRRKRKEEEGMKGGEREISSLCPANNWEKGLGDTHRNPENWALRGIIMNCSYVDVQWLKLGLNTTWVCKGSIIDYIQPAACTLMLQKCGNVVPKRERKKHKPEADFELPESTHENLDLSNNDCNVKENIWTRKHLTSMKRRAKFQRAKERKPKILSVWFKEILMQLTSEPRRSCWLGDIVFPSVKTRIGRCRQLNGVQLELGLLARLEKQLCGVVGSGIDPTFPSVELGNDMRDGHPNEKSHG
ncbi:hypothetical protein DFH06DRAFT_1137367 [Mycena polygramma]|nr:hypothetical protein DFH06DRAFT_1137367 [Mycena polygramma]